MPNNIDFTILCALFFTYLLGYLGWKAPDVIARVTAWYRQYREPQERTSI